MTETRARATMSACEPLEVGGEGRASVEERKQKIGMERRKECEGEGFEGGEKKRDDNDYAAG